MIVFVLFLLMATSEENMEVVTNTDCLLFPPDPFNIELGKFEKPKDWPLDAFVCFQFVSNVPDFHRRIQDAKERGGRLFTLFFASPDEKGNFWCPDCQKAAPVIRAALPRIEPNSTFLISYVGNRCEWKVPENQFRTDPDIRVQAIPTLLEWFTSKKLVESDLFDEEIVSLFITAKP